MRKFSLLDLLRMMETRNASDIHLKSNNVPVFRVKGDVIRLDLPELSEERLKEMLRDALTERDMRILEETGPWTPRSPFRVRAGFV